jgi:hypothetical protein
MYLYFYAHANNTDLLAELSSTAPTLAYGNGIWCKFGDPTRRFSGCYFVVHSAGSTQLRSALFYGVGEGVVSGAVYNQASSFTTDNRPYRIEETLPDPNFHLVADWTTDNSIPAALADCVSAITITGSVFCAYSAAAQRAIPDFEIRGNWVTLSGEAVFYQPGESRGVSSSVFYLSGRAKYPTYGDLTCSVYTSGVQDYTGVYDAQVIITLREVEVRW